MPYKVGDIVSSCDKIETGTIPGVMDAQPLQINFNIPNYSGRPYIANNGVAENSTAIKTCDPLPTPGMPFIGHIAEDIRENLPSGTHCFYSDEVYTPIKTVVWHPDGNYIQPDFIPAGPNIDPINYDSTYAGLAQGKLSLTGGTFQQVFAIENQWILENIPISPSGIDLNGTQTVVQNPITLAYEVTSVAPGPFCFSSTLNVLYSATRQDPPTTPGGFDFCTTFSQYEMKMKPVGGWRWLVPYTWTFQQPYWPSDLFCNMPWDYSLNCTSPPNILQPPYSTEVEPNLKLIAHSSSQNGGWECVSPWPYQPGVSQPDPIQTSP